jgi:hypothetical protein
LGAGEVGGLRVGFDEIVRQFDDLLVTATIVCFEHFFPGVSGGILGVQGKANGKCQEDGATPDPVQSVHPGKA